MKAAKHKQPGVFYIGILLTIAFFLACAGNKPKTNRLTFVSEEEELRLGNELSTQVQKQLRIIRNQEISAFFNQIAKEIAAQSDWTALPYKVYIVNEPDYNHFSLPGGSIFIFRGLIELANNASEIALIIAHEIAHLSARDGVDRLAEKYAFAFAAQSVIGENPEIAYQIVSNLYSDGTILDYPREKEYLADQRAIKYAWKANYDPNGLLDIMEKLRAAQETEPQKVTLLNLTHPSIVSRYKRARVEISKAPHKSSLRKDLPEFKNIKNLLSRIPE